MPPDPQGPLRGPGTGYYICLTGYCFVLGIHCESDLDMIRLYLVNYLE